jgi:hypothetical protein
MLLFGKIYTSYSTKMVFLSAIGLFEIGLLSVVLLRIPRR